MTRDRFLSQSWKAYPVLPTTALFGQEIFRGRVREILPPSTLAPKSWSVTLERQGREEQQYFPELFLTESATTAASALRENPLEILIPGDLVAILPSGEVTLLAPCRQSLPARDFQPQKLGLWQDYIYWLRQFFREQGFLEIATPSLVPCPGTEPTLDPFNVELIVGSRREKMYLPTSPELHLKKALALGAEKIFEVRSCFRNGEVTDHHQPEFTMIEWYRAYEGLSSIRKDVINLVSYLGEKVPGLKVPEKVQSHSVASLFKQRCDFAMLPTTTKSELQSLAEKCQVDVSSATTIDDLFFLLFLEKIEAAFVPAQMTFVEKYPPYQAALARLSDDGWGERFEMYWQGLEIANAFHELNDPTIQQARFAEDLAKKNQLGKTLVPIDEEFMQCLEAGMPPSSGIALGVERLFMALTGIQEISKTRLFPLK